MIYSITHHGVRGLPGSSVVKNQPANAGDAVLSLGQEDPLEENVETYSSIPAHKSYYDILFPEEQTTDAFLKSIKNCVVGKECPDGFNQSEFHFIKLKENQPIAKRETEDDTEDFTFYTECQLAHCTECSLDETYCETCNWNGS